MNKLILVILLILIGLSLFASGSGSSAYSTPPSSNHLIDDRIRNTPAIDPSASGSERRFYVTTFGLQSYDRANVAHNQKAPKPIYASLVMFGIVNTVSGHNWSFSGVEAVSMENAIFNQPETVPVNCYNAEDLANLETTYSAMLNFTGYLPSTTQNRGTEGIMRYYSGTGSWASPVFYKDSNGSKHLIILNKSGCLMSVDVTTDNISVDWKLNLRNSERAFDPDNSHRFEFMATPVLVDNHLYIAGIKLLHVINLESQIPTHVEYNCSHMTSNDYFESPVVFDTIPNGNRSFYFISKLGIPFRFDGQMNPLSTSSLGISESPPLLDSDGHVYFVTYDNGDSKLNYIAQEHRSVWDNPPSLASVAFENSSDSGPKVKSSILTDFTRNKYMFRNDQLVKISGLFDFDPDPGYGDPISYPSENDQSWMSTISLSHNGIKFPGNHSLMSYHNDTMKSFFLSTANLGSSAFGTDVLSFYPSTQNEYPILSTSIKFTYVCINNSLQNPSTQESSLHTMSERQTWGGVAPYHSSVLGYLNALLGDECGDIVSYKYCVASGLVDYTPVFDEYEDAIPEMGSAKFLKNLDNIPTNNEVNSVKVCLCGLNDVSNTATFVNSYVRQNQSGVIPNTNCPVAISTFDNLLPNKRYKITWKGNDNLLKYCDNVEIKVGNDVVVLNAEPDMVIENTLSDPDLVTTWAYGSPLHFNSVTLNALAHWKIAPNSQISVDKLYLNSGSMLTIGDGANLVVGELICNSIGDTATINVDGNHTGKLTVKRNLENKENSSLLIKGYNLVYHSYTIQTVINKQNASLEMRSMNSLHTSIKASVKVSFFQNRGGSIYVNDCVLCDRNYRGNFDNGACIGSLYIRKATTTLNPLFGNLILTVPDAIINSPFYIGDNSITSATKAKLTIQCGQCTFQGLGDNLTYNYNVYGNIVVEGDSKCIVGKQATLIMKSGSKIDLKGDLNYDTGAQVIVRSDPTGGFGTIKLEDGVQISGYKPDPDPNNDDKFGDRIVTDELGEIIGVGTLETRKILNLQIITTNVNEARWEGIYINTYYSSENKFKLISTIRNQVSGIDKLFVQNPGQRPEITGIDFVNCTYGVQYTSETTLINPVTYIITDCKFKNCKYGIYLEDSISNPSNPLVSAYIKNCDFGDSDGINGFNNFGIVLRRAKAVKVNDCRFYRNSYGIFGLESSVLVGGDYSDLPPHLPTQEDPCFFYNNNKAGISLQQCSDNDAKSLIYKNIFSGNYASENISGIGIIANESKIDVIDNVFQLLGLHGMLLKTYNWYPNPNLQTFHGFAANNYLNNLGSELIGDGASLSSARNGLNLFNDVSYHDSGFTPQDPFMEADSWDRYLLANYNDEQMAKFVRANMLGNIFQQSPLANSERFYPEYDAFMFEAETSMSLYGSITLGINQFYQGLFDESIGTMKQIIDAYPDSSQTKLAIDYLYLATRATSEDFSNLRAYLDLKIPSENLDNFFKKEEVKTKCFIKEGQYLTAILRLQEIIDNPRTLADSLFALIDQAYCYLNLASSGAKSLPQVAVCTQDFPSYLDLLVDISSTDAQSAANLPLPRVLSIESNYPNPFNPETTIRFTVPKDGRVQVKVFNVKGQMVKELVNEQLIAGKHATVWNGTDKHGKSVSSGLYFARIEQGGTHRVHKMMLMK